MPLARNIAAMFAKLKGGKAKGLLKKATGLRKTIGGKKPIFRTDPFRRAARKFSTNQKFSKLPGRTMELRPGDTMVSNKAGDVVRRVGQVAKTAGTAVAGYAKANPFKTAAAATAVGYTAGKRRQKQRMMRGLNRGKVRRATSK
jgi:hypothetical protein